MTAIVIASFAGACGSTGDSGHFSAGLVDIGGGRKINMECDGVGAPTVLLVSGKGNRADTWSTEVADPLTPGARVLNPDASVFHQVARFTRVCAYDRPATVSVDDQPTRSDAVNHPVTAQEGVDDLRALLAASATPGPYVVVGHSYGGLIARLFASTHPDSVTGLVLEDALSEGLYAGLTPAQQEIIEALNSLPEPVYTVRSFAQVVAAPPVRAMPMVILTADLPVISAKDVASGVFPPAVTVEFIDALWSAQLAAQAALAKLFPNATHITNTHSHHYIHVEQPKLVIDSIRNVVEDVRRATP